jgi:hypothetical protein
MTKDNPTKFIDENKLKRHMEKYKVDLREKDLSELQNASDYSSIYTPCASHSSSSIRSRSSQEKDEGCSGGGEGKQ